MVLGLWNKRYRKGYRYAAIGEQSRTEWCWVHGTRDTEKITDMKLYR